MAVRIRLTRVGATKRPAYRVIAIDRRRSRDGRALEILGFYDPLTEPATVQLQSERISAWIGKGAQPSDTVLRLMRQAEKEAASPTPAEKPRRPARPKASSAKPKASKPKAAATASAEEPPAEASTVAAAEAGTTEAGGTPDESTVAEPGATESTDAVEATASTDTAADGAADSAVEPAVVEEAAAGDAPAPDGETEEREA